MLYMYNNLLYISYMSIKVKNRIAALRAERGLSRQTLAGRLKVNYQTIGYLERGEYNPSLELALRIATFFELPVEMIFSLEPLTPLSTQMASLKKTS